MVSGLQCIEARRVRISGRVKHWEGLRGPALIEPGHS